MVCSQVAAPATSMFYLDTADVCGGNVVIVKPNS